MGIGSKDSYVIFGGVCYNNVTSDLLSENLAGALNEFSLDRVDRRFMEAMIEPAVQAAEKNGAYLYCGEYGVTDQAPLPDTLRWFEDIHATFEKYGI